MPHYMEIAKEYDGKVKFTKVDCSVNKRVAMGFRVMGLPTFLFWKDGAEVKRLSKEECTPEAIRSEIDKLIA